MTDSPHAPTDPEDVDADKPSQAEGDDASASGTEHEVLPEEGKPSKAEG